MFPKANSAAFFKKSDIGARDDGGHEQNNDNNDKPGQRGVEVSYLRLRYQNAM